MLHIRRRSPALHHQLSEKPWFPVDRHVPSVPSAFPFSIVADLPSESTSIYDFIGDTHFFHVYSKPVLSGSTPAGVVLGWASCFCKRSHSGGAAPLLPTRRVRGAALTAPPACRGTPISHSSPRNLSAWV